MDLTQIRYFLALARTLNFTRAAETCNVTQPALTKSIQRLEDELGGPLLLRERALTQLTTLGTEMLPLLEQIQAAARRAKEHAADLRLQAASPLRIGFAPDAPAPPFAPVFAELAARMPSFKLTVAEIAIPGLVESLLNGALDVGVVTGRGVLHDRVNRWMLFQDLAVLLVPEGHALDGVTPLEAETARSATLICRQLDGEAAAHDGAASPLPPARHHANTAEHAADLARAGLGVTWSTEMAAPAAGLSRRRVAWREQHDVVLVAVAGRPLTRTVDAFIKLTRARAWPPLGAATVPPTISR